MKKILILVFVFLIVILSLFLLKQEKNELKPVIQYVNDEMPQDSPVVFGFFNDELSPKLISSTLSNRRGDVFTYNDLKQVKYTKGIYLVTVIFDKNSPYYSDTRDWNVFISKNINKLKLIKQKYYKELSLKVEIYKFIDKTGLD